MPMKKAAVNKVDQMTYNKKKKSHNVIKKSRSNPIKRPSIRLLTLAFIAIGLLLTSSFQGAVAGETVTPPKHKWDFKGPFGVFKREQLQRGFQVYKEVCSVCHGLDLLRYDKLEALGFSKEEIKAIAGEYEVPGPLNEDGEPTMVKATPGDSFANPYPNKQAGRAANNGAFPPDLSLMTKARAHGTDYLQALLTGYEEAPDDFGLMDGMYYNAYFSGHQIAMPPPLTDNQVEYVDGTKATVEQMSKDVVTFLAWAAEPEMEQRRNLGVKVIIFLLFFTFLMRTLMRRTWRKIKEQK